jgi:predicted transcriptional regulator
VTDHDRAMLLSVRPRYAESILSRAKRAEIRRQRPSALPGTPVIIYATKPIGAVIGTASIGRICEGSPSDLWEQYHDQMGVTRDEFDLYLSGLSTAYLLLLDDASRLVSPLTLDDMRESADFQPPRSYRYVDHEALRTLVNGHPAGTTLLPLLQGLHPGTGARTRAPSPSNNHHAH